MVNTTTTNEMAAAIAKVVAKKKKCPDETAVEDGDKEKVPRREAMAEGMVRVVRRMWNWMAEPVRQDETGVAAGVMHELAAPERTRVELGEEAFDPDEEDGFTPEPIEIGRASPSPA
jgi:hypothetical protein